MAATTPGGKTLSRDYKHVKKQTPGGSAFNGWTGLAAGLAIGLTVALGVHLHYRNLAPPVPQPASAVPPASARASDESPVPGTPPAAEATTDLTFYTELERQQVEVPESSLKANSARTPAPGGEVTLQAGAFAQPAEAEKLQAKLAQYGVDAKISRYSQNDETLYRVRIGPIGTVEELEAVRAKLSEAEVEAMPVTAVAEMPPP
jgi:cell division protein FtsN